jgi:uncharacterized membrane protein
VSDPILSWVFRIVLAALAFAIVWFGLPWLLELGGLTWPLIIIFLLACLAALAVLSNYWWGRRVVVP